MGTRGHVTGKGGGGRAQTIAHRGSGGELSPLASQSVLPADRYAVSLNIFTERDNSKSLSLLPYSKCELSMTDIRQIEKPEVQKGQSHRIMNQEVELVRLLI